jgi:hypothetical protein
MTTVEWHLVLLYVINACGLVFNYYQFKINTVTNKRLKLMNKRFELEQIKGDLSLLMSATPLLDKMGEKLLKMEVERAERETPKEPDHVS